MATEKHSKLYRCLQHGSGFLRAQAGLLKSLPVSRASLLLMTLPESCYCTDDASDFLLPVLKFLTALFVPAQTFEEVFERQIHLKISSSRSLHTCGRATTLQGDAAGLTSMSPAVVGSSCFIIPGRIPNTKQYTHVRQAPWPVVSRPSPEICDHQSMRYC